jgi:hypothetical protein
MVRGSAYFLVSGDLADTTALRLFVQKRNGTMDQECMEAEDVIGQLC